MANPTGISRAALRQAAYEMRMIEICANQFYQGKIDADDAMRAVREHALRAEIITLRLHADVLVDVEKERNGFG